jgi:predicted nucleic acid-binding protein
MAADSGFRVYLDTNVFLDAVEGTEEIARPAIALLDRLRSERGRGVTSEITLLEVLPKARIRGGAMLHRRYLNLLVMSGYFNLVPVSRDIIYAAVTFRERVQLAGGPDPLERRAIDALHVATALTERCSLLVTGDKQIKVPRPLQILSSALALSRLSPSA